ncbi:MAG: TolC family protein [Elusimicrobia bacterium]|nr:TolC family protein [Elusimicrobiota bacterium]
MTLLPAALALALAAAPAPALAEGNPLTLEEAVSIAVKNSPAALAAEQDIIITRQRVSEARFMALPQLALYGSVSRLNLDSPVVSGADSGGPVIYRELGDYFYQLRAQALQPLYTGGRNTNVLKLAKTANSQAKVNFEAARSSAALEAKRAFYSLLYHSRIRGASSYWLELASKLSSAMRKDPFEEMEAAMLLSSLSDRLAEASEGLDNAKTDLLKALNREPGFDVEAQGDFRPLPVDADVSRSLVTAMEARPELKSEVYKAQMEDIAVNMALVRRYPTIFLSASYDLSAYKFSSLSESTERNGNWLASVGIRFPLSYDIWTQVQQRRAQQRQGELKRAELQDNIRFGIISAHKEAVARQQEAARLSEEFERMKAAYETASRPSRPSMSQLRALCSLCGLERKYLDAVYKQLLARIRLEWAQGRDFQ